MDYKKLIIRGISYSQTQANAYALLLEDEETAIKLPVVIGSFEAQSISLGLEKDLTPPRPLTHDLFASFIRLSSLELVSVIIYKIVDGVFYSNLNFIDKATGENSSLDARTSDAVAIAVRFNIPIYTTPKVLDEAGILLDLDALPTEKTEDAIPEIDIDFSEFEKSLRDFSNLPIEDLENLLENAVKNEDYDTAFEIQEIIKQRKNKN